MRVVDADAHWMEPADLWSKHGLPIEGVGWNGLRVEGAELGDPRWRSPYEDRLAYGTGLARVYETPPPWSPEQYVAMLDREGIDVAVMFPTRALGLLGAPVSVATLFAACAWYGAEVADFAHATNGRFRPVGLLPLAMPMLCPTFVEEGACRNFVAVVARPNPSAGRWLLDPDLEDTWSALEEYDMPLVLHEGTGAAVFLGQDRASSYLEAHAMSHPFEMMAAVCAFTVGGILERHPKLRVGFFEAGAWWVPGWLDRLDDHALGLLGREYGLPMLPSQYFARQCAVTLDAGEVAPSTWRNACLYASDLPHGDSAFPYSRRLAARANQSPIAEPPIFAANAVRFFGLEDAPTC